MIRSTMLGALWGALFVCALPAARAQVVGGTPIPLPLTAGDCVKALNAYQIADAGSACASGAPTGAAGGDLSGTYPNPTVVAAAGNLTVGGNATVNGLLSTGVTGSAAGQLRFFNATSGLIRLQPTTGALGNVTLTLPDVTSTVATVANTLGDFSPTTSAQLAAVISDETGSGPLAFATSPTLTTPAVVGSVNVTGTGAFPSATTSAVQVWGNSTNNIGHITMVDSTRTVDNRIFDQVWSGGSWVVRYINDAATTPVTAFSCTGGAAIGATNCLINGLFNVGSLSASLPVYTDASKNLTSTAPAGYSAVLSGTTAAIGGSPLLAGACSAGTVTVTGATSAMAPHAAPSADPDSTLATGIAIYAFVSSANTVTVRVCAIVAVTPAAVTYNVRVLQ